MHRSGFSLGVRRAPGQPGGDEPSGRNDPSKRAVHYATRVDVCTQMMHPRAGCRRLLGYSSR